MNYKEQGVIAEKPEEESNSHLSSQENNNQENHDSTKENASETNGSKNFEPEEINNDNSEREEIIISGEDSDSEYSDQIHINSVNPSEEEEIEECFFGMNFLTNQHPNVSTIGPIAVEHKTIVCLYFSAYWCPPCQNFTPLLIEFYNRINKLKPKKRKVFKIEEPKPLPQPEKIVKTFSRQRTLTQGLNKDILYNPFEVIYYSKDTTQKMFDKAISNMPWLNIPFEDSRIDEFMKRFKIKTIPSLVVLGNRGELVTLDGRLDLMTRGFDSWIHWTGIQQAEDLKRKGTMRFNSKNVSNTGQVGDNSAEVLTKNN